MVFCLENTVVKSILRIKYLLFLYYCIPAEMSESHTISTFKQLACSLNVGKTLGTSHLGHLGVNTLPVQRARRGFSFPALKILSELKILFSAICLERDRKGFG